MVGAGTPDPRLVNRLAGTCLGSQPQVFLLSVGDPRLKYAGMHACIFVEPAVRRSWMDGRATEGSSLQGCANAVALGGKHLLGQVGVVESHGPTLEANLQHQSVHQRSCISRPAQASPSVWMFKTRIVMIDVSQAWQCSDHGPHGVADSLGRPGPCTT